MATDGATDGATGGIRRGAGRGLALLGLGSLGALMAAVLIAPAASAATVVTIGKTAPAPVTVDAGQAVTFVNGIPNLTVSAPGPLSVKTVVSTVETLGGACGGATLGSGASYSRAFSATSTCSVSYAYSVVSGASLATVQALLPPLPAPVQVVVDVVAKAVSSPPPVPVPLPAPAPVPVPAPGPVPSPPSAPVPPSSAAGGGGTTTVPGSSTTTGTAPGTVAGGGTSSTGVGAAQTPVTQASGAMAFDPARFSGMYEPYLGSSGAGGSRLGSYDGASVPVFGQLAGLSGNRVADAASRNPSADGLNPADAGRQSLPVAAVAAVVTLAAVTAGLIRTHRAQRASR